MSKIDKIKANNSKTIKISRGSKYFTKNGEDSIFAILPLIMLVFLLPFIIRLKPIPLHAEFYDFGTGERVNADFFTYYKQIFIYIITIWSLINVFLFSKKIKFTKAYYFMGAYAVLVILSSVLSKYPQIAFHGFTERKEGMWIVLCYLFLMFSTINLINTEKQIKILIHSIGISGLIIAVIAVFQYFGMDIFASDWGKRLIIPKSILEATSNFKINLGEKYSYSVFYNPNYLGGYMSLYVPLMLGYAIIQNNTTEKLYFILLAIVGLFATVFSRSEAGVLGISIALGTMLIMFIVRRLLKNKKPEEYKKILLIKITPIFLIPIVLVVSLSYFPMESNPLERIRKEAINLVKPSDYVPLTKETGPINEIMQVDNSTVLIEIDKKPLNISIQKNNIVQVRDEFNSMVISADLSETATIALPTDKYGNVKFIITPANDKEGAGLNIYNANPDRYIKIYLITDGKMLSLSDSKYKIIEDLEMAPSIGFEGKANLASGRGYIWSRSIPIILRYPIIGSGQDTFITLFPNADIFGSQKEKLFYFWNMWTITDKPHNTYLQIGIHSGISSLLIGLIGLFILLFKSFKTIIVKNGDIIIHIISFAVLGFMISSIFNDSIIAITPIVYILLGINVVGLIKTKNKKVDS